VSDNLESALREYEEFGNIAGKEIKGAKEKLMQKLTDLDRPDVTRQIFDFVSKNKTWEVLMKYGLMHFYQILKLNL
jgi:hypothetical protein